MPRRATLTNSLSKGVMDPNLLERIDLQHYWNALEDGLNLESRPQGGIRRRDGTTSGKNGVLQQRLRRRIVPLPVVAGMVAANNGGTIANLIDQSLTTTFVTGDVAGAGFVLFEINLGAPADVCFVDLAGYSCASGRYADAIAIEYWDGDEWVAFGARKDLSTVVRARRIGLTPGFAVSAQVWRVVAYGAAGAGAVTIGRVRLWTEQRRLSPVRGLSFARALDDVYELTLTDRNIDVFQDHVYVASVPVPVDAQQVLEASWWQEQDTMFLYHEDVVTQQVVRQGAAEEWNASDCVFTDVPTITPGMAFSGDADEVQDLAFANLADGDTLVLWFADQVSAPIVYSPATFVASVTDALVAFGVSSGFTVTQKAASTLTLRITFQGSAGGRRWPVVMASAVSGSCTPATSIVRRGIDSDGPIFGDTTGYPRCGAITDERQLIAGFRSAPMSFGFSRYGDVLNFKDDADPLTADLGFFATLNAKTVQTIHQCAVATDIHFFTETGEWWANKTVIDATLPLQFKQSSANGIKSSVPVVFGEDAMLFVQRGGTILRDMVYSDVELKYKATSLSLIAPHLLKDVVDFGFRQQRNDSEANHLYLVNADGSICFAAFLRSQEVVSLIPWDVGGKVRAIFGDMAFKTWLLVERETEANGADLYLEELDGSHTLDAATTWTGAASATIPVGSHLEGLEVWAWAERDLWGPYIVAGGEITLPMAVTSAQVGLFPIVRGRLPRFREKLQNGYPWRPPARIYTADFSLAGTGDLDVAMNGKAFRKLRQVYDPKIRLDIGNEPVRDTSGMTEPDAATDYTDVDIPLLDRLLTGNFTMSNLLGFSKHPTLEFSQSIPAPLEIKAIRCEVVHG